MAYWQSTADHRQRRLTTICAKRLCRGLTWARHVPGASVKFTVNRPMPRLVVGRCAETKLPRSTSTFLGGLLLKTWKTMRKQPSQVHH